MGGLPAPIGLLFRLDWDARALLRATHGQGSLDVGDIRFRSAVAKGNPQRSQSVLLSLSGKPGLGSSGVVHGQSEECKAQWRRRLSVGQKQIGVIERGVRWF
jgi:hypothetical protein